MGREKPAPVRERACVGARVDMGELVRYYGSKNVGDGLA